MISLKSIAQSILTTIRGHRIKISAKDSRSLNEPKKLKSKIRGKNGKSEPKTLTKRIELSPLEYALMTQAPIHMNSFERALINASKIQFNQHPLLEKHCLGIIVSGNSFSLPSGLTKTCEAINQNRIQL